MKVQVKSRKSLVTAAIITAGIIISTFGLVAWAGGPKNYGNKFRNTGDTIPSKEKKLQPAKDFDKELRELDKASEQLEKLGSKDWDKMRKDIEESIKEIDLEKINVDIEHAISKIDMEKIGKEIEASLSKIDFDKIEKDVEAALDEVEKIDREKIRDEIQRARAEVESHLKKKEWKIDIEKATKPDMEEVKKALEKANQEMRKAKEDLKLEELDLKETMVKARDEVNKAKEDLRGYQEMVYSMEKDSLLKTNNDYTIEYKNGEIFINGKKQSSDVVSKYRKYFKQEEVTIRKENGDLQIDVD